MARAVDESYYRNHGSVLWENRIAVCCEVIRQIPMDLKSVLEVGPYQSPMVNGCVVMDLSPTNLHCPNFPYVGHNAAVTPWPFENNRFDLVIASAVWEHLGRNEELAWREIVRISRWALLVLPFRWTNSNTHHNNVDFHIISQWTGGCTPYYAFINRKPNPVYIGLYDLYPYKKDAHLKRVK